MDIITKKSELKELLSSCISSYKNEGLNFCIKKTNTLILAKKIKFPLLEYAASEFFKILPLNQHLQFCDGIEAFKTIGGNVLVGIILQKRLEISLEESFQKAAQYISDSKHWYVSDIIGERVFGFALLKNPKKAFSLIKKYTFHENNMVQRATGAGMHYAIKKGLAKNYTNLVFELLLSKGSITDYQTKRGIGWAAKTMARFHPDVVIQYQDRIEAKETGQWFRTKVRIGLERNTYAKRN